MKLVSKILSLLVLAAFATFYMSCDGGGGDDQSQQQIQFNKLKSVWTMSSVSDSNGDRTDEFMETDANRLTLTLDGTFQENGDFTYELTGPMPPITPWRRTGSWKFDTSEPARFIIRDEDENEVRMEYEVTAETLLVSFNLPDTHPGWSSREKSIKGDWTFTFVKQD